MVIVLTHAARQPVIDNKNTVNRFAIIGYSSEIP